MAHTCPDCGQYCTCGGDWDDCDMGEYPGCIHCLYDDEVDFDEEYDETIEDPSIDPKINPLE